MIKLGLLVFLVLGACATSKPPAPEPAPLGDGFCSPVCDRCHVCVNPPGGGLHPGICIPRSPKPFGCP